jgi:hypothetical protein
MEVILSLQAKITRKIGVSVPFASGQATPLRYFDNGNREVPGLKKKPSTSELLDWLKLLLVEDVGPDVLRERDPKKLIPPLHGRSSRTSRMFTCSSGWHSWRDETAAEPPSAGRRRRPRASPRSPT